MRGRPFLPGNCANPYGRPRTGGALAEYIRRRGGEDGAVWVDRLADIAAGSDKRLALQAIEVLLTRGYSKPPDTTVTVNASDGVFTNSTTFTVAVTAPPANTAPTISDVTNRTIAPNVMSDEIYFTVGDGRTEPALLTVTASSANQTLIRPQGTAARPSP